jgi:hypothetical protein
MSLQLPKIGRARSSSINQPNQYRNLANINNNNNNNNTSSVKNESSVLSIDSDGGTKTARPPPGSSTKSGQLHLHQQTHRQSLAGSIIDKLPINESSSYLKNKDDTAADDQSKQQLKVILMIKQKMPLKVNLHQQLPNTQTILNIGNLLSFLKIIVIINKNQNQSTNLLFLREEIIIIANNRQQKRQKMRSKISQSNLLLLSLMRRV